MNITKLIRKCKYSRQTIFLFCEFKKKDKAQKALHFHEMKIAFQVAVLIFVCQMLLIVGLSLLRIM